MKQKILLALSATLISSCHGGDVASDALGTTVSPGHKELKLICRISAAGGFREMYVFRGGEPVHYARDVTAYLWLADKVIYSTSPIYGQSGIFLLDPAGEISTEVHLGKDHELLTLKSFDKSSKNLVYDVKDLDSGEEGGRILSLDWLQESK